MPLILIGGGARSGKSAFALDYARRLGEPRVFIATAQAFDDEMRDRIARHREERGAEDFVTVEEPLDLVAALGRVPPGAVVLVDCLTLWLSNLLLADQGESEVLRAGRCAGGRGGERGAAPHAAGEQRGGHGAGAGHAAWPPVPGHRPELPTSGWRRWPARRMQR